MNFTELDPDDIDRLVELNSAAYPAVPITDPTEMGALLAGAGFTLAAREGDTMVGFVIGMRPGSKYNSENYRWFDSRGTDFLYVDRIVIDQASRGSGIGRMLYTRVFEMAEAEGRAEVTCEVNLQPPNPESLAFHDRLGFSRVGEQATKNGSVVVALLAAPVRPA